jgi:excinuclease ABC subunit A
MDVENSKWYRATLEALALKYGFSLDTPIEKFSDEIKEILLYGTGVEVIEIKVKGRTSSFETQRPYEGLVPMIERRYGQTESDKAKEYYEEFMLVETCGVCKGARLKEEVLSVKISGLSIVELTDKNIQDLKSFFEELAFSDIKGKIADKLLREINSRLTFLVDVGLNYLSLGRKADSLSGGEMQRIRLATQIGTKLTGVLYVLDEPTIGLHQRDNDRLIGTLLTLKDLGNTLVIVEHDEQTIRTADYIVDMGPEAGVNGGRIVAEGTLEDILASPESLTAQYLKKIKRVPVPSVRRPGNGSFLELKGATTNNLKNLNVKFPLGKFIVITGVSGSGKSSLITETLLPAVKARMQRFKRCRTNR